MRARSLMGTAGLVTVAVLTMAATSAKSHAVPLTPGPGVINQCPVASCDFLFWDGDGNLALYQPAAYQDVLTPSGNETETFKGTIANNTGHAVIYSANSGDPVPAGQTCYSFRTNETTADWQLTISASGNFSLVCHFHS